MAELFPGGGNVETSKKRLLFSLALIFALNIVVILLAQSAQAATYRQGSSGQAVQTIQEKLVRWGYFDGPVDLSLIHI